MLSRLEDALSSSDDHVDLTQLGEWIILPSSYIGGPHDFHQRYLDGMAIAQHFKKIDIFLTMTANPNWPKIVQELLPGQTVADRPDLVSHVFYLKKKALLNAIVKDGIFGPCVAHVYVIEFQKRGLPHMHLLIFLKKEYKLLTPDIIDCIISAKWPNPMSQPQLFAAVHSSMVHGPCGALNPKASCMRDNKCMHGYPKPFQDHTLMDHEGYPLYAQPDDGQAYPVEGYMLDNQWIVPYSPFCLLCFRCHINVECTISFGSMKYINKYLDKGSDCGTIALHDDHDEVKQYIDGRYSTPHEAVWRIQQYELHGKHLLAPL